MRSTEHLVESINRAARELAGERVEHGPIEGIHDLGKPLLTALGVDLNLVLGFVLHCEPGEVPHIEIKRAIPAGSGKAAALVLELFDLVPRAVVNLGSVDSAPCLNLECEIVHRVPAERDDPQA